MFTSKFTSSGAGSTGEVIGVTGGSTTLVRGENQNSDQRGFIRRGMQLGSRYTLECLLGRGGMGEVYKAFDHALDEWVALKFISPILSNDPDAVRQFKSEVQLARRIAHPNVCRIYDLGSHGEWGGCPMLFLTMELIEGQSLRQYLKTPSPPEPRAALVLAADLLKGLAAAHASGVLHRDLKPDNIMLRNLGDNALGKVALMDFGLASALSPLASRLNGEAALVGSLVYMAPEQILGEPLRRATDIYAFGLILFEMLTGEVPFVREGPALLALQRLQKPAPRLREVTPHLPAQLDLLLDRCLRRAPEGRFAEADEVLEEVLSVIKNMDASMLTCGKPRPADRQTSSVATRAATRGAIPRRSVSTAALLVGTLLVGASSSQTDTRLVHPRVTQSTETLRAAPSGLHSGVPHDAAALFLSVSPPQPLQPPASAAARDGRQKVTPIGKYQVRGVNAQRVSEAQVRTITSGSPSMRRLNSPPASVSAGISVPRPKRNVSPHHSVLDRKRDDSHATGPRRLDTDNPYDPAAPAQTTTPD